MTEDHTTPKVPCTRCGRNLVDKPETVEEDPLCTFCQQELAIELTRMAEKQCPGYGPEACGNALLPDEDLCPDCNMARMDDQSPRPPR